MRIKLDENLPASLVEELNRLGHDVDSVPAEGLTGKADEDVWTARQNDGRLFITQDLDFSDIRKYTPGTHHGLVLVRLADPSRSNLLSRLISIFGSEPVDTWSRCFVTVTDLKIRMRKGTPRKLIQEALGHITTKERALRQGIKPR